MDTRPEKELFSDIYPNVARYYKFHSRKFAEQLIDTLRITAQTLDEFEAEVTDFTIVESTDSGNVLVCICTRSGLLDSPNIQSLFLVAKEFEVAKSG